MSTDWRWCADAPREAAALIDEQRQDLAALRAEVERLRAAVIQHKRNVWGDQGHVGHDEDRYLYAAFGLPAPTGDSRDD